jgi:hypothetical protein
MVDALERHTGKRPIIYTDITFYEKVLEGAFNSYPYWVRSVAAEPKEHCGNHTRTLRSRRRARFPASRSSSTATHSPGTDPMGRSGLPAGHAAVAPHHKRGDGNGSRHADAGLTTLVE